MSQNTNEHNDDYGRSSDAAEFPMAAVTLDETVAVANQSQASQEAEQSGKVMLDHHRETLVGCEFPLPSICCD